LKTIEKKNNPFATNRANLTLYFPQHLMFIFHWFNTLWSGDALKGKVICRKSRFRDSNDSIVFTEKCSLLYISAIC